MNIKQRLILPVCLILNLSTIISGQGIQFTGDIAPAEGLIKPQEKPFREEICLNGSWEFQPVELPADWEKGNGIAPVLTLPLKSNWESTPIKIPSPWNINSWGGGSITGKGSRAPYAPSSVYFPSYPEKWESVRMGWLRKNIDIPEDWKKKRIILHLEAVIGDFVVLVNGKEVGHDFGGYLPYEVDITEYVDKGKKNEFLIGVRDRRLFDVTSKEYKYFRATYPPGSYTDQLIGIWQDVYLHALPEIRVTDVFVKPLVDQHLLTLDVEVINQTNRTQQISISGQVKEWINIIGNDVLSAPEIDWKLGQSVLAVPLTPLILKPGEKKKEEIVIPINGELTCWQPENPALYVALLEIRNNKEIIDCKSLRFGWRQFLIHGKNFYLNGEKIQCFADIQHPFGAFICSRRFAWAWYKMILDFGGNTVRLHAQPWPRFYYDLADEMGIMVVDESALFGSSLALNFEEEITWERTKKHLDALVMRDRNHPSVIGWSIGNELFAVAMYNKPPEDLKKLWDDKIIALAKCPAMLDPTRPFITDDGDEDMGGILPVWSKHFGHGLGLKYLPDINKPIIIGESGATYYGKPQQLYQFAGEKAYKSYYGRNEALATDLYQNVVKMARPFLAYFSPSEVCWFGLEHMNLGYSDYSRLPSAGDGIFMTQAFREGKPGYQMERIPPYVSTFNPGLDPSLPLYKPLPMFEALKAALAEPMPEPCPWDSYEEHIMMPKPDFPETIYSEAYFVGSPEAELAKALNNCGLKTSKNPSTKLIIIDGDNVSEKEYKMASGIIDRVKNQGGLIWVMMTENQSDYLKNIFPYPLKLTNRKSSSLQSNKDNPIGKYFSLPDLYFSELKGNREILKTGLDGELVKNADLILEATNVDWSLFNNVSENRKCAQLVLYEHLKKESGIAMVHVSVNSAELYISSINYKLMTSETIAFWKTLCRAMGIEMKLNQKINSDNELKKHDLLLDGPVENNN